VVVKLIPTPYEEENKRYIETLLKQKKHYELELEQLKEETGKRASLQREYSKAQLNEVKTRLKSMGVDTDETKPDM
jgi:hypothetical protein